MATCWTCGGWVSEFSYTCTGCASVAGIQGLRQDVAFGTAVQAIGFARLTSAVEQLEGAVTRGLDKVANAIIWGVEDIKWHLQQTQETLKQIDDTLRTPTQTQSNEFRLMAEQLAERGVLDEAQEFYEKALDLNRLDYRTYVSLAMVLLRRNNYQPAISVLERSLPHAPPSYDRHLRDLRSYSLRLIAHIHTCTDNHEAALEALRQAIQLSPTYHEAHYDYAKCSSLLHQPDECGKSLQVAIELEPFYWSLSRRDRAFVNAAGTVKRLLQDVRANVVLDIDGTVAKCQKIIAKYDEYLTALNCPGWVGRLARRIDAIKDFLEESRLSLQKSKAALPRDFTLLLKERERVKEQLRSISNEVDECPTARDIANAKKEFFFSLLPVILCCLLTVAVGIGLIIVVNRFAK
jgi:tetratricopeptide (TPR) repeat protein